MSNKFRNALSGAYNFDTTANGALAHKSTGSKVYDMFAMGAAYRGRSAEDCITLFSNAYNEDPNLAMKCLFYIRDCRGGQGERRFFRECFKWLCEKHPKVARMNLENVSEYGRWDDLWKTTLGTPMEKYALNMIYNQLMLDIQCKTPSLLAKWLPSENASSATTKKEAEIIRKSLKLTNRQYRKILSGLRNRINVLERLMSAGRWDEIVFDKIPSKAGLIYKNAFARRDIIARKYEKFIRSDKTKVNASTLYPYEVTKQARNLYCRDIHSIEREAVQKYWDNLPDYFGGKPCSVLCMVDTSCSMTWSYPGGSELPINVATALGIYCAERMNGPFKNSYISFSHSPRFIEIEGADIVDKVRRIEEKNLCQNTDLDAAFDMLLYTARRNRLSNNDLPKTICVISDMQIDRGSSWGSTNAQTNMERNRLKWRQYGYKMPNLVYWNVNASKDTILDLGPNVSYVSGCSPSIMKQVLTGKTGYDLMIETITAKRYDAVHA